MNSTKAIFDASNLREHYDRRSPQCANAVVISEEIQIDIRKIARHGKVPVVISGETGTGKEEVAKLIHRSRVAMSGPLPFVPVNCANIHGDTAVSVLFGHKKGAFTGATQDTSGFVSDANGGILFLDEIHCLTIDCQQRLLRVLNDGHYSRLGETKELHSNFQVIVATTRDLDEEVDAGRFLIDLRNRLIGYDLSLKPLRERKDELPVLIAVGLARYGVQVPEVEIQRIAKKCAAFYWRGNIRQLFMVLQTLIVRAEGDEAAITAENLPVLKHMLPPGVPANTHLRDQTLNAAIAQYEKSLIQATLVKHATIADAASALGLGRSTLDDKRRKYGL